MPRVRQSSHDRDMAQNVRSWFLVPASDLSEFVVNGPILTLKVCASIVRVPCMCVWAKNRLETAKTDGFETFFGVVIDGPGEQDGTVMMKGPLVHH
jgi:hypothetical protein